MISKETKEFWKQLGFKTFSMFGFTYFSVAVATQSLINVLPSLLASGLYFFTELMKYYKLQPDKKVLTKSKHYNFLI